MRQKKNGEGKLADFNRTGSVFSNRLTEVKFPTIRTVFQSHEVPQSRLLQSEFERLVRLPVGWDGYRAKPVSFGNASYASQLLDNLCQQHTAVPSIVPGYNGDLQMEWHVEGFDLEIHVISPYHMTLWCSDPQICPEGEPIVLRHDISVAAAAVKRLAEIVDASDQAAA